MIDKTVVLFDVDGKIPNLALMKISTYYKQLGFKVKLSREIVEVKADKYFASAVFNNFKSNERLRRLRHFYGDKIKIGGSGADIKKRLLPEIENCFPDYELYNHSKYAVGFLTRGCDKKCKFCLVPEKEGRKKVVGDFSDFVPANQKNVLLLDDNLLSFPKAKYFLSEMTKRRFAVNFSQTLDLAYLNEEIFNMLIQVDSRNAKFTKRMYYFSCNNAKVADEFYEKKDLLMGFGKDAVTVVMMYGFNTYLSEDYKMLFMLRRLRLIPFLQQYQPIIGVPSKKMEGYFDFDIDKVIRLTFRSNGQNWEKYLRWLNQLYFKTYGRYYRPLVEKIYRYNNKNAINRYLNTPDILTNELYKVYNLEGSERNGYNDD